MSSLLVGLLSALVATNPPAAVSNLVTATTGVSVNVPDPNDPVARELQKLMDNDDAAQAEVDGWIRENREFADKGGGIANAELNRRIRKRFEPVRAGYEDLIKRHPSNAAALVAYSSFLNDVGDLEEALAQLEKARELSPKDPAIWNNLGVYYSDGHHGPPINSFHCFEKAIELKPSESLYYHNFADAVYMFRRDAEEYYHIDEPQVFDKALALYTKALKLDPTDFPLATDLAEAYYGIRPMRTEDALIAWTNALQIAHDEIEREGVYLHLARVKLYHAGRFDEVRAHLNAVTNSMYAELKKTLERNLEQREKMAGATNRPPAAAATATSPGDASTNSPAAKPLRP